jgi:beta-lactam-binding protein with PASTA domain
VVRETVPNVVKDSDATATAVVKARHLVPKFVGGLHGVYAQSIKAGTVVNEGTTLTLSTYEEVPNVVGLTWTSAEAVLKSRGFVITHYGNVTTKVYGESLVPGKLEVIGTRITIDTYGLVPNVVGLTWASAETTLHNDSLSYTTSGSGSIVESENPAAGTQVKLGTVVTLTLGAVVPNVVGDTVSAAEATLGSDGLGSIISVDTRGGSIVESESPLAGTPAKWGSNVTLTLESVVPNVVGDTFPAAWGILENAGLSFQENGGGIVQTESPVAGTLLNVDAIVTLTMVVPAAITLSLTSGTVGTEVTISGTGFTGGGFIDNNGGSDGVAFDGTDVNIASNVPIASNGTWSASFIVPNTPYGYQTVKATDNYQVSALTSFTVVT